VAIETIALIAMYLTIISIPSHPMVRNDCGAVTYVAPRGGEYPGLPARAIIAADGAGPMTADLFRFHVVWPTSGRSLAARLCVAWLLVMGTHAAAFSLILIAAKASAHRFDSRPPHFL